jgi:hypothetical protein
MRSSPLLTRVNVCSSTAVGRSHGVVDVAPRACVVVRLLSFSCEFTVVVASCEGVMVDERAACGRGLSCARGGLDFWSGDASHAETTHRAEAIHTPYDRSYEFPTIGMVSASLIDRPMVRRGAFAVSAIVVFICRPTVITSIRRIAEQHHTSSR